MDLRLFTLFHLDLQLLESGLALGFRLFTFANLLIQLRDVIFQLHVQLQIALSHLLQLVHQPRKTLAGLFELLHHHREKVDRPGGDQQTEEDRADNVDTFNLAMQHHGDRHLYHNGQHHQRKSQQHRKADQTQLHHQVDIILRQHTNLLHRGFLHDNSAQ